MRLPRVFGAWRAQRPIACAVAGAALLALLTIASSLPIHGTGEIEVARMVGGGLASFGYPLAPRDAAPHVGRARQLCIVNEPRAAPAHNATIAGTAHDGGAAARPKDWP